MIKTVICVEEIWKHPGTGQQIQLTRYEGNDPEAISSMSSEQDLPRSVSYLADLRALGFEMLQTVERKEVPTLPNLTVHTVFDQLCEIVPEAANHKLAIQALIKRLSHVEKHSVYSRIKWYGRDELPTALAGFLNDKIQTHLNMANEPDEKVITWKV